MSAHPSEAAITPAEELVFTADELDRLYWRDLVRCRHAFLALAKREFVVRYRQTIFGAGWALVRPAFLAGSLAVALYGTGAVSEDRSRHFFAMFLSIVLWQLFSSGVTDATNSLVAQRNLVTKLYIPRIYVPSAQIFVNLADLFVGAAFIAVLYSGVGYSAGARLFLVLPLLLLLVVLTLAAGWIFAALNVRYRDFRQVAPFFLQVSFFLSPVTYSLPLPSEALSLVLLLNPVTGILEGMKYAVLGAWHPLVPVGIAVSFVEVTACAAVSLLLFRRLDRKFSDII